MEDKDVKLKTRLFQLIDQFKKQDNPMILRDISVAAYRLMNMRKEGLVCCPTCKEPGLITTYIYTLGQEANVFHSASTMKCDNKHEWRHNWAVGDRVLLYEPLNQYYVYVCTSIAMENIKFKRIFGDRYFPATDWGGINDSVE